LTKGRKGDSELPTRTQSLFEVDKKAGGDLTTTPEEEEGERSVPYSFLGRKEKEKSRRKTGVPGPWRGWSRKVEGKVSSPRLKRAAFFNPNDTSE